MSALYLPQSKVQEPPEAIGGSNLGKSDPQVKQRHLISYTQLLS